jgi:hypothetical protein
MKPFYVELSSNAPFDLNTVSNFKNRIQLLHPLEGEWEVGISEISYTKSWRNLKFNSDLSIEEMFSKSKPYIPMVNVYGYAPFKNQRRGGVVRAGFYETVEKLCDEIEQEMTVFKDEVKSLPEFFLDPVTKLVIIKPGVNKDGKENLPRLSKELSELLGYDTYSIEHPPYNENQYLMPQRPAEISAGITSLFVYCNIIVPQYVGDTRAKLLRAVEIPNNLKFGDQAVVKYENPHYIPLVINDFEYIEIDIKDDANDRIRFMYGRTRIKLHFRKCQIPT